MACRVWSNFQVTKPDGSIAKMRIQDLPENRFNEAVDLFSNFMYEEAFHKASGIPQNPKAVEEARLILIQIMKDPTSNNMICREDNDSEVGEIFGISSMSLVLDVRNLEDPCKGIKLETKEIQIFQKLMNVMATFYKAMAELHISHFYDDRGMFIHPGFRKLGIATEFLRARRLACVAHNVPATGALMTAVGTQKAAKKDNWETILDINLDKIGQQYGVTFSDGAVGKCMIWRNSLTKIQE